MPKQQEFAEALSSDGHATGVEYEPDTEISVEITDPFNPTDINIKTRNPTIDSLMKRLEYEEINLTPDFQRKGGIWKLEQKSRLIESLLLNIPLPVFYVAADKEDQWLVVDGLQRMTTLNEYVREQGFALQNLEFLKGYEGKRFKELPRVMQRRILEAEPVFHVIQPGTPKDVTRTIFKRINTGGLPLSHQEIRHALYQGAATHFLQALAESEAFLIATNYSINDDRMADRECVLRYLAFSIRGVKAYKKNDLDKFLSETMEMLNQTDAITRRKQRHSFMRVMRNTHAIFEDHAFRKMRRDSSRRHPINKALFESWSVTLGQCDKQEITLLKDNNQRLIDKFIDLLEEDDEFVSAISQTTNAVSSVHLRFKRIQEIIEQTLQELEQ